MLRDRVFLVMLGVSAFLHLTMITLFSIEMRYQTQPITYHPFGFFAMSRTEPRPARPGGALLSIQMPHAPNQPFSTGKRTVASALAQPPSIAPPVLNFPEIAELRLEQPTFPAPPAMVNRPEDAWAVGMGGLVNGLRLGIRKVLTETGLQRPRVSKGGFDLGQGLVARIRWMGESRNRRVLLHAKIGEPWHDKAFPVGSPDRLEIVFQVTPEGRVEVVSPVGDENSLQAGAIDALKRFRFEALPPGHLEKQAATFIVERKGTTP